MSWHSSRSAGYWFSCLDSLRRADRRRLPEMIVPRNGTVALTGQVSATLLAVFAFIGFEGLANVAEEVRDPKRNLPRAIFLTLGIATVLYIAVVWIALVAVGESELAKSEAS